MTHVISSEEAPQLLARLDDAGETPVVPAGGRAYLAAKRVLDVIGAIVLLVLVSPVMVLAAAAVKLASRGPVFFAQERAGKDGEPFVMYKFRTMRVGAEDDVDFLRHRNYQNGPVFKLPEDPRLTSVGKFLRRSSIDELPQLFNVLRGDMSLVGPRPLWLPEAQRTTGAAKLRTLVRPGLTCLWQISGRSELSYEQWILLDLYYLRSRSLLLDMLIIAQTVPAVLSGHGAY
jgi:lipopolysaccharide/colanic/teichoic acid biosynthesis glycosyltransferase